MIYITTLFWEYKIYNFRWKDKKDSGRRQIFRCEEQI